MFINKYLFLGLIIFFTISNVRAGVCEPAQGSAAIHYFTVTDKNFQNEQGKEKVFLSSSNSRFYVRNCEWNRNILYSAYVDTSLVSAGGGYYYLREHPELLMNIQTNVYNAQQGTSNFYTVPFYNKSNSCNQNNCGRTPVATGSNIKLYLVLQRQILGSLNIDNQPIFFLSGSNYSYENNYGHWLAKAYLSIHISVPQNCTIDAGSIIEINFGQIQSNEFNSIGQKPSSANRITKDIPVTCQGVNPGKILTAKLTSSDSIVTDTLASSDDHIGFKFSDKDDNPLYLNNTNSYIPFKLETNYKSNFSFKTWPISKDGKTPTPGKVNGQAFLILDYQ